MILVSFWLPFDVFWCLLAPFWHPWAPFCPPWAPSRNKDPSGANWGRIRGPNRSPFWSQFSHFLVKKRFCAVFFDVPFSASFFYRFLPAPGYPKTMKIKQNHCSVARNQGLAKVGKTTSRDHFWLDFGGLFGALERHFRIFWCILAFWFSVLFCDAEKHAKVLYTTVSSRPCHPLKDMRQHGIKSGIKP